MRSAPEAGAGARQQVSKHACNHRAHQEYGQAQDSHAEGHARHGGRGTSGMQGWSHTIKPHEHARSPGAELGCPGGDRLERSHLLCEPDHTEDHQEEPPQPMISRLGLHTMFLLLVEVKEYEGEVKWF